MVLGLKLRRKTSGKIKLRGGDGKRIVILDFTEKTIKLPNGDIVRRDDIIQYDPQNHILVYRSPSGELRTLELPGGDRALGALFKALAERNGSGSEPAGTISVI